MAEKPSKLMLDECYAAEDERFLDYFVQFERYDFLRNYVESWLQDPRPWAREQIQKYLLLDLNFPGHEVVVKRLFKHFERDEDHEMMAYFMVSLDRLVRRVRRKSYHYDWATRQSWMEERLFARPNKSVREEGQRRQAFRGAAIPLPDIRNRPENRVFSQTTRAYLRRRVWRYFRRLSYRRPMAYVAYVALALRLYRDQDFAAGENILDNWSLMHACYYQHEVLQFTPDHANLIAGRSLAELNAAPYQLAAWQTPKGSLALVELIAEAQSGLVRLWALELLEREHPQAINEIAVETLIKMLSHVDPRVQQFAAEAFKRHRSLAILPVSTWLELLNQSNLIVLTLICDAMREHVSADRLSNDDVIALCCARPVPVARLGFDILRERHSRRPFARSELKHLAAVRCSALASEITAWALSEIGTGEKYELECVIEFFDALLLSARRAALDWLDDTKSPGYHDPVLWARLSETPFEDVKLRLVDHLDARHKLPGTSADRLSALWVAVILGVHRGGRAKRKAVMQVAEAVEQQPQQADVLLPVLAVALRSIRAAERRQALAAVARLGHRQPQLREQLSRHVPELQFVAAGDGGEAAMEGAAWK